MEKYHRFKVVCKSENGEFWYVTVSTVDMVEAYRMVEDTGLDGSVVVSITLLPERT